MSVLGGLDCFVCFFFFSLSVLKKKKKNRDQIMGNHILVLGFLRENQVYFHPFGEFVAVFQESMVCFAPLLSSSECAVYLREFLGIIPRVLMFVYY